MGYYTNYEIVLDDDSQDEEIAAWLTEKSGYTFGRNLCLYDVKWYDHKEDMLALSKAFPNILFTLSGDGEESGDMWRLYVRNGKSQYTYAEMRFDEFDERKLT